MNRMFLGLLVVFACGRSERTPAPAPAPAPTPTAPATPTPAPTTNGSAPDLKRPCSMITADEVGGILGFPVTVQDDQFRCKFIDAKKGWLQLELMEAGSRGAKEICEYAKDKRTVVPGVGDSASYFGATACVKVGDVAILVDGANLAERSAALGKSGAESPYILVAKLVASRIP